MWFAQYDEQIAAGQRAWWLISGWGFDDAILECLPFDLFRFDSRNIRFRFHDDGFTVGLVLICVCLFSPNLFLLVNKFVWNFGNDNNNKNVWTQCELCATQFPKQRKKSYSFLFRTKKKFERSDKKKSRLRCAINCNCFVNL